MRQYNLGKIHPLLAGVLVLATLAASAGAGILYQYLNGNKIQLGEDVEPEEEPAADDGPKRLSIPPIGSGDPNNTRPERTEPFKFVYTDRVSTNSKSGAAKPNPVYNAKPLSAKEFEQGNRDFMLQAVDHYRSTNSDKDSSLVDKTATLLQKIIDSRS